MDRNFRKLAFEKLAAGMGPLTAVVEGALNPEKKIEPTKFSTLGQSGVGTTILATDQPITKDKNGNCVVHITINFRGLVPHSKAVQNLGLKKGVLVTAEAVPQGDMGQKAQDRKKNLGSSLLVEQFPASRIKRIVDDVMSKINKKDHDCKTIKPLLHLSGFSGGGSIVAGAVDKFVKNPEIFGARVASASINDGLHVQDKYLDGFEAFARMAMQHPEKYRLQLLHTAIKTRGYPSTTETANYMLNRLGLNRKKYRGKYNQFGFAPESIAEKGGVRVLTAYNKSAPYHIDNRAGSAGDQHVKALSDGMPELYDWLTKFQDEIEN